MEVEQEQAEAQSISKEEFREWQGNKITQFLIGRLTEERNRWMMYLANGNTIKVDSDLTTDFVVGRIQGLNDFILTEYEESAEERKAEGREKYGY